MIKIMTTLILNVIDYECNYIVKLTMITISNKICITQT